MARMERGRVEKTKMETRNFKTRAKFFTGEGVTTGSVWVDTETRTVRVWDRVAGHYTLRHALSDRAIKRILKQARA